jgi:hypothetical protein
MEEDGLVRLRKILKDVSAVPHKVDEFTTLNPPPAVSLLLSHMYFSSLFSFLKLVDVDLGCLQEWGQNFDDMPLLPLENNPGGVGESENQGRVSLKLQLSFRGVLWVNPDCCLRITSLSMRDPRGSPTK